MSDQYNWLLSQNQNQNQTFKKPDANVEAYMSSEAKRTNQEKRELFVIIDGLRYYPINSKELVCRGEHQRVCSLIRSEARKWKETAREAQEYADEVKEDLERVRACNRDLQKANQLQKEQLINLSAANGRWSNEFDKCADALAESRSNLDACSSALLDAKDSCERLEGLLTIKSRALTEAYCTIKAQDERIKAFEQAAQRHSNLEDKELHLLQELQEETKAQKDVIIEQEAVITKLQEQNHNLEDKLVTRTRQFDKLYDDYNILDKQLAEQNNQLNYVADIISVITKPR